MAVPPADPGTLPVTFEVGRHRVVLVRAQWRWSASVDGAAMEGSFASEVEAWEAGVRAADQLDRGA